MSTSIGMIPEPPLSFQTHSSWPKTSSHAHSKQSTLLPSSDSSTVHFPLFPLFNSTVYGFHKVPHLNDGALHTESAPEVWEFTNISFTRDNPDLADIVRKKNEAERARSAKRQGSPEAKPRQVPYPAIEAPPNPTTPRDMAVVYEEIRNIKRHQNAVIGELKRLKTDNDALWTEAAEARARYDQQQTTINKMLKFLSTVFSPNKSNAAGSLANRSRGLLTGPSAFEELSDDSVLTPEAQETGARELSNLFGGQQPILPTNAGDAAWWQNLVKNTSDGGLLNLPNPGYLPQNDNIAPYEPPPAELAQHRNSLAAMEHAVDQTDQSIGRISNVLGINDWDNYNYPNPPTTDGLSFDAFAQPTDNQPEYRFEDFIRSNPFLVQSNNQIPTRTEQSSIRMRRIRLRNRRCQTFDLKACHGKPPQSQALSTLRIRTTKELGRELEVKLLQQDYRRYKREHDEGIYISGGGWVLL